jgi:hypothetical protein
MRHQTADTMATGGNPATTPNLTAPSRVWIPAKKIAHSDLRQVKLTSNSDRPEVISESLKRRKSKVFVENQQPVRVDGASFANSP